MIRFCISLAAFFGWVIFTIMTSGSIVNDYLDISSLLIVGIVPLIFVGILYGIKEIGLSFSMPFKHKNDENNLTKAYDFFKIYGKTVWIAAF